MKQIVLALLGATVLSSIASAQSSQLERARFLLRVGYPEPALAILETLPETPAVIEGRARAHIMIASQIEPAGRCDHLRRAVDLGSMSSSQNLVEFARRRLQEEGCAATRPQM
jgi:hypothetical protein